MEFTNEEYADIVFIYGYANGNASAASREYLRRFPNKRQPSRRVFSDAYQRLRRNGIGSKHTGGANFRHNAGQEEQVIDAVLNEPGISTRRIASRLEVSHSFVWRTIHREVLHPYHKQNVQHLQPNDHEPRLLYCQWLLRQHEQNPNFISSIVFSDEATFTRDGINNTHNEHVWSLENPHAMRVRHFQQRFSINVWGGIFNGRILPIIVLPNRLNAESYLMFLQNELNEMLEDVPVGLLNRMWFQHDGAPPHIGRNVVNWLNNNFNGRWIGRRGPILWPARSPDLNPLDFYLWGHMKQLVYAVEITTEEQLMQRIIDAAEQIQNVQDFGRVYNSVVLRCQACINAEGHVFENVL